MQKENINNISVLTITYVLGICSTSGIFMQKWTLKIYNLIIYIFKMRGKNCYKYF
jgi:hypothetical protein